MRHATPPQSCFICCVLSGSFYCFCTAMPGFFFFTTAAPYKCWVNYLLLLPTSKKFSKTKQKQNKKNSYRLQCMWFYSEVLILSDAEWVRAILVLHCNLPELTTRILPPCLCYTLFISSPIHAGLHSHSVHGLTERGNEHRGGRRQTARAFPGNLQHSKYAQTIR